MKAGDLVTVIPSKSSTYLLLAERPADHDKYLGRCWLLYNELIGVQRMHEKWIEVLQGEVS